ncbi:ABC transporter substrate-binding protein [Dongia mobilis]|jgi:ABC-type amino acid transport substrate-binding protein|uniref:substrate-binding periplasmic protein n=1 Tax=Dongia sp. TaxID=1977262 RepID=UPI0026EBACCF
MRVSVTGFAKVVSVIIGIAATSGAMAQGRDPARDFGCARPLRIAVMEFGAMYHDGAGVDADIIGELMWRSGCLFEIREIERADIWSAIEADTIDMATSSIATPGREKLARFVTYFGIKNMLVLPIAEVGTTFSLDALVAKPTWRIGLVRGFRYGNYYDYQLKSLLGDDRMVEFATQEDLFQALRRAQVEAILTPSIHYFFYLTEEELDAFTLVNASPAPPTPSGLAFSRATFNAAQVDNWLRLIEGMRLDRTLHRFAERHIPKAAAATMIEY